MMIKQMTALSTVMLMLAGCAPAPERRISWIPPQGISGRDAIRDRAVCRDLSGAREAMMMRATGGGGLAGALEGMENAQIVQRNFAGCMSAAGYIPSTETPSAAPAKWTVIK